MEIVEIISADTTTIQRTADRYDKLAKERQKREQISKTRARLQKQQQQLVQMQRS